VKLRASPLTELLRHLVLCTGAILILAPFVWAIAISVRAPEEIFTPSLQLLPSSWAAARNYGLALTQMPLLLFLWNGLVVCSAILVCQLVVMVPCSYALAKLEFPGRKTLFALVIIGMTIPSTVLSLPLFLMISKAGAIDSYAALVMPWSISVLGIFLVRQVFMKVPDEIIEAARLDGLSESGILIRIMLPMAMPAIGAFSIFSFVRHWNDLLWPSVVVRSVNMATPPYGVMLFQSEEAGSDFGALMAGAVIIALPMIIAFLVAQKRFMQGVSLGAAR
jgi:multiple sugar transport system permease protein